MIRTPYALLVRQRALALAIPQLGLNCDAREFPTLPESAEPLTYWWGVGVFDGIALPYPLRGAGTVREKNPISATVAVSRTTMYAILAPPAPDRPAIWLAAPIAQLDIAPSAETSGVLRKKPFGLILRAVEWQLTLGVTNQIAPETRRKSAGDALQMLAAIGGTASGRARPSTPGDRPMVALCAHGTPSTDGDSVPALDATGGLVLESGEDVLWTGTASVVTTSATAAYGKEVFGTMWSSADRAAHIVLTSQRLVYLVGADAPQVAPIASAPDNAIPALPPPAGATVAGHVRHANVCNIITGDGGDYGAAGNARITATLLDPLTTGIQVHLLVEQSDRGLADAWVQAAAGTRLASFPELELQATEKWEQVAAQASAPTYKDGHIGTAAVIPLYCRIGEDLPR
jgi:hypothetical protein